MRIIMSTKPTITVGSKGNKYTRRSELDRFLDKCKVGEIQPHMTTPCVEWTGAIDTNNRGVFSLNGKRQLAYRIAYMHWRGAIPDGMFVCHHCDNPKCVEPPHLFLGTPKDNTQDMISKGRQAKGSKCWKCILTEEEVIQIKILLRDTPKAYGSQTMIAREMSERTGKKIKRETIKDIASGRIWSYVQIPTS